MNAAENVSGAPARLSSPWWIVLGATLALVVGNGPVGLFSFGLFIKPIGEEFGWDRATMSSVVSIPTLLSGIMVPIIGAMMDRWGVKRVL
ncbi:MAG: MFS transporter, partial [Hyphomonadaceae bacterium]